MLQDCEGGVISGKGGKGEDALITEGYVGEIQFLEEVFAVERGEVNLHLVGLFLEVQLLLPEDQQEVSAFLIAE